MSRLADTRFLRPFLAVVALLGVAGICAVYALQLNYPPIRSDGLGYYLYLPGAFLYHDLGLGSVAEFFRNNSIPYAADAPLWRDSGPIPWGAGTYLIKYPLGTALLMMPFFFAACLLSLAIGTPLDGFSPVFQYAVAFSGLCYALAGMAVLWRVLRRDFGDKTVLLAMTAAVFGTDLFHYATYDSVFSHAYSFFLFALFLWLVGEIYGNGGSGKFLLTGLVAGLIIVTRPTNALWLVFGPLYGVRTTEDLGNRLAFARQHAGRLLAAVLLCFAIVSLQLAYWYVITGKPLLFSYRGERFYFLQPEILNVLFSVRKGLFFWSPVLLTVFPGLWYLRRQAPAYFLPAVLFLPLNVYLIASWHNWFYGGSFGHRAFIESIPLFAICFCALYEGVSPAVRKGIAGFAIACVCLECWLMLKYWTGVIPFDGTTWDYFVRTFFVLTRR